MALELFHMTQFQDVDLQASASGVLSIVPLASFPPNVFDAALDTLMQLVSPPPVQHETLRDLSNWHVKVKALPLLQIIFFNQLHQMSPAQHQRILMGVAAVLGDSQVEVRQLAADTLAGLVRCSGRGAVDSLRAKFEGVLDSSSGAGRRRIRVDPAQSDGSAAAAVAQRHGAVLGLSALILAFPYDVPVWVPAVVRRLAACASDRPPISTTVNKTFSEFRRTHQDGWHDHLEALSEEDSATLTDLLLSVSSS
ncbi:hypothetical protein HK405_002861, partial [Cladochytrium tenue]